MSVEFRLLEIAFRGISSRTTFRLTILLQTFSLRPSGPPKLSA